MTFIRSERFATTASDMQESPAARLEVALQLAEFAVEIYEAKVRRDSPGLSDEDVVRKVIAWQRTRPGSTWGDAEGRHVAWPRTPRTP